MESLDLATVFVLNKKENPAIKIIEDKISYMQSVDAEMFYLTIGVLKDLIISIKEIK
jgi:hypothetical protein